MKLTWKVYASCLIALVASVVLMVLFPNSQVLYGQASTLALIAALYQIFRDEAAYQKSLIVQHDQHRYELGATTHMADVVFNKHYDFCEEYHKSLVETIKHLVEKGPSEGVLNDVITLCNIRFKYAVWLTKKMDKDLELFEDSFRKIGANSLYYKGDPSGATREGKVDEMYSIFNALFYTDADKDNSIREFVTISKITNRLRDIVGTESLTGIRNSLLSNNRKREGC